MWQRSDWFVVAGLWKVEPPGGPFMHYCICQTKLVGRSDIIHILSAEGITTTLSEFGSIRLLRRSVCGNYLPESVRINKIVHQDRPSAQDPSMTLRLAGMFLTL